MIALLLRTIINILLTHTLVISDPGLQSKKFASMTPRIIILLIKFVINNVIIHAEENYIGYICLDKYDTMTEQVLVSMKFEFKPADKYHKCCYELRF